MFNTTKHIISCVRQTKTPESTSVDSTVISSPECGVIDSEPVSTGSISESTRHVDLKTDSAGGLFSDAKADSKADSSSEFELAIALFKSFFFVPGLSMETVEQFKDFKEGAIHSGVLILYSKNGVLSADRPTGDYNRYMMNTKFPEYLSVTIVSDGEAVSFKLKPTDAPTVTDSVVFDPLANDVPPLLDQHQMRAFKAKIFSRNALEGKEEQSEPSERPVSTTGAIRQSALDVSESSKRLEDVLSKVQSSGLIDKSVRALSMAESMSQKLHELLPNISGQVKGVMTMLGISCSVLLATVTVVMLFYIIRKVLLTMSKEKALQVLAAAAGVLALAGIACSEFSTAGSVLTKYCNWLREKWTSSVHAVGSIAWNMNAPDGEELLKRMARKRYVPARHSLLILDLSGIICSNVGWECGLQFLIENICFLPASPEDESLPADLVTFLRAVHNRSFSTISHQVLVDIGAIHNLDDEKFADFMDQLSLREHDRILESDLGVEHLSHTIVARTHVICTSVQKLQSIKAAISSLQNLSDDEGMTGREKRRAKADLLSRNRDKIKELQKREKACRSSLDSLGIKNSKTKSLIKKALYAMTITPKSWLQFRSFDFKEATKLPEEVAKELVHEDDTKQPTPLTPGETVDQHQGAEQKDGLNSLFALLLALVRRFQNPSADTWGLFKQLRSDSNSFKVGMSAASFLAKMVPDSLRIAAFAAVGLGDPDDVTEKQRDVIAKAFHIHKFMTNPKAQTTANKIVWLTAFESLSHLMSAEFMTQKSKYTLGLCQKAYQLMLQQLPTINHIADTAGHRPGTIGIWLYGPPGCGKSTLTTHLAQSLFADHPPNLRRHTWNMCEKFMTGFKDNHASIEVDDLGSNIPALQQCDFWGQALTMLSTKPVTVSQADIASKGMAFNAFAMFLQSNRTPKKILDACSAGHFLTNPEAVRRRFRGKNGVMAKVVLNPAFADEEGNADETKISQAAAANPHKTPWCTYEVEGESLQYEEFVARIVGCLTAALYEYKANCEAVDPGCHVDEYLLQTLKQARDDAGIDATYGIFPSAEAKLDTDISGMEKSERESLYSKMTAAFKDRREELKSNLLGGDTYQMQRRAETRYRNRNGQGKSFFASMLGTVETKEAPDSGALVPGCIDSRPKFRSSHGHYPCGLWSPVQNEGKDDYLWTPARPAVKTMPFAAHTIPVGCGDHEDQDNFARFCADLETTEWNDDGSIKTQYHVTDDQFVYDDPGVSMTVSRVPSPEKRCFITWKREGTKMYATITGALNHPGGHCNRLMSQIRDQLIVHVGELNFCSLPPEVATLPDGRQKMYLNLLETCPQAADKFLNTILGSGEKKGLTRLQHEAWDDLRDSEGKLTEDANLAFEENMTVEEYQDSFIVNVNKAKLDKQELKEKELQEGGFLPRLADYPSRALRSMKTILHDQWLRIKGIYENFVSAISKINWKTVAKALGIFLGASTVAYGGWKLFQHYTETKKEVKVGMPQLGTGVVEQAAEALLKPIDSAESLDDRAPARRVNEFRGKSKVTHRHFQAVRPKDSNQMEVPGDEPYLKQVIRNTCSFSPHPLFEASHHGAALFIIGRRLLMNAHYIGNAKKSDFPKSVTVRQQGIDFHAEMRWEDLDFFNSHDGKKTDFMVWRMPSGATTIPDHPKIFQHFPRASELRDLYVRTPFLNGRTQAPYFLRAHTGEVQRHDLDCVRVVNNAEIYSDNLDGESYTMPKAAMYSSRLHKQGWCGSLVVTANNILGIHAIGRNAHDLSGFSTGLAQVFTYEMFEKYMGDTPQMMTELDESSCDAAPLKSVFGTHADTRGLPRQAFMEFSLPSVPPLSTSTRYRTTGLAENGSLVAKLNEKVPSVLHFRDPRYTGQATSGPEFQASLLLRYENPPKGALGHRPMLKPVVLDAINAKLSDIPAFGDNIRVWSLHEALNPRHCNSVLNSVPRSTSSGMLHKGPGKMHYIGYDEAADTYFAQGGLEGKVADFLLTVENGKLPLTIYGEFCKDELLTRKKIAKTPSRTISGSPLTLTMVTTMAFGAFLDSFQRVPHKWGHTVGVNIMGREWDETIKRLKANSDVGFDGDFKAFDTTMSYQFMRSFFEHVDKWYKVNGTWSEEDRALRWACVYSLCFSKHACGKTVFTMFSGMCSGSRLTTIMNCFWSKALIMYAYAALAPDDHVQGTRNFTLDAFDRHVVFYVLGDDNFGSVKPEIEHWFNPASISKALASIGIRYTPAQKDTEHSTSLRPVEELEFLANTTGTGPGFDFIPYMKYYPVIKTSSVAKMLAYMKPSALPGRDACNATADNLTAALLSVHLSGQQRFDYVRQSVQVFRKMYPYSEHKFPTFEELNLKYYPLDAPTFVDEYQGITMSKTTTNVSNVQSSGVELNQDNSLETKTAVDARAGMDAPNVPVCQMATLQQGAPFPASGETVTFAPVMGITPVLEKPDTSTINTGNDMDFNSLMRMTWRDSFEWKELAAEGEILWQTRICPNGQLLDEKFNLGQVIQPTALTSVCSNFRYWHGGIRLSLSAVMSGVHVGRIGICVIYGSNVFPTTFSELTQQRYAVAAFDGLTKDVTIELPYVSTTRLKEVLSGPSQADIDKCCTGTVSIFVMNQLRSPQSAATGVTVNVFEGAAEDLKLYVPGANASTTYVFDALETPELKLNQTEKVREYKSISTSSSNSSSSSNRMRDVYQMMSTETPQAMTSQTGSDMPVVMSSVSDVAVLPTNPIIKTPQTLLTFVRRQYVFGNNLNGVTSTLRSCNATAPFATGGLSRANMEPWMRLTDLNKYSMYFRTWFGPGLFSVYDQSGQNGISMSFHPTVDGPVTNAGPFNSGTAQYDQTSFSGAWMFAPPRMGFANAVTPFTTVNHALKIPHFAEELGDDANTGAMQFQVSDAKARAAYTFSGGDGLHFGVRFAVPLMVCGGTAVQPDTWEAVPVSRLRQARDQYQMDTPSSVAITGDDKVGVTLLEQDNQEVEEVHSEIPHTSDTKIIGQPQLDFCHFMERDQWLANFEWKTSYPVGDILYTRPVPFGLLKNTAQRAVDAFRYFKMDAVITIKVQATQFHQGRLCLMSMPMTSDQSARSVLFGVDAKYAVEVPVEKRRTNWTFGNHAFVDAAASATVTFTIPFRYIRPYLVKNENFAQFYVAVFNPLKVGIGGSVAASCTVFVHFERCDLRVINPL